MPIDLMSAFTKEPPELDFIWPGFLTGTVGALVAPGGTGKSFFALEAAIAVASSDSDADLLKLEPKKTGKVVYFSAEDPEIVLTHRLHAIGKLLSHDIRQDLTQNLIIETVAGKRMNIMNEKQLKSLIEYCVNSRLIIIDTLSRVHTLDENSNGDMSRLISTLDFLAQETGAAILFIHHTNKGSASTGTGDQQQAARGASALIDNARWCGYVSTMSQEEAKHYSDRRYDKAPVGDRRKYFLKYGTSKQNYGIPVNEQWMQRTNGGVLISTELYELPKQSKRGSLKEALEQRQMEEDDSDF